MQNNTILILLSVLLGLMACQPKQDRANLEPPHIEAVKPLMDKKDSIRHDPIANSANQIKAATANKIREALPKTVNKPVIKRFTPQRDDTLKVMRARLYVPKGSLERDKTLSVTLLKMSELPMLPKGLVNVTDSAAGFRFLPHGEHFKKLAAKVVIPFDTTLIPPGYTTKDIHTYYYDEARKQWTALPTDTVCESDELALAYTTHFTDMINGIIKVPESPETQGYAPNSITDIKAANPATGIMAMAPPSATQSGAASLSYPFNIPPGRKGMQPSLGLQYSSEGREGWVGYGWSLFIPTIDIETRWGVPLFDTEVESESYLVMGQQLTAQAHRTPDVSRTAEKQFYPRVEGSFSRIIRHGDSPKNYWWQVTDKSGTTHFFGGVDDALNENAVVRNTNQDIVQWALVETRNVYGDFVRYTYEMAGGMLYPTLVNYTGRGDDTGVYRVELNRHPDASVTRKDKTSNGRLGFLQYNNQQLNEVKVYFKEELLRSYQLNYREGAFGKTLLAGVTEKDGEGNDFNTHTFDYYNDVEDGLYGEAQEWDAGNDKLTDYFSGKTGYTSDLSAICGGYSNGSSAGGGVMVGVGWGSSKLTVNAGVVLVYSKNENKGMVSLVDINGDGLPDKVFIQGFYLYYRPNISNNQTTGEKFGEKIKISGMNQFSYSESKVSSRNINTGVGVNVFKSKYFDLGGGMSIDKAKSTDVIKVYLSDFNGDGLVDIANNGTVYFNYIAPDGHPHFTPSSTPTPNPISGTDLSGIDDGFMPDYEAERKEMEEEQPLLDVVRVWRAPYSGTVTVTGNVALTATALEWQGYPGTPDGIIASIQHQDGLLWKDSIMSVGKTLIPQVPNLAIQAGEMLLFRLQSRYSGALDEVKWSPEINYNNILSEVDTLDENGIDRYRYDAETDVVFCGQPLITLATSGEVNLSLPYNKQPTSDDVDLVIQQFSNLEDTVTEIYRQKLEANQQEINNTNSLSLNIAPNDTVQLYFTIESTTQIDWTKIVWKPKAICSSTGEEYYAAPEILAMYNKPVYSVKKHRIDTQSVVDEDEDVKANPTIGSVALSDLSNLPDPNTRISSDTTFSFASAIRAIPFLKISEFEDEDSTYTHIQLSLRDSIGIFVKHEDFIDGKDLIGDTLLIDSVYEGSNVLATFFSSLEINSVSSAGLRLLREKVATISDVYPDPSDSSKTITYIYTESNLVECDTLPALVYSKFNRADLGNFYRGWGQFAWDGRLKEVIDTDELKYDEAKYEDLNNNTANDTAFISSHFGDGESLYLMSFMPAKERYQSVSEYAYISHQLQSASRIGAPEIVVDSIDFPTDGKGLAAPVQKSRSVTQTISAHGFVASYSNSDIESQYVMSAIDLNGDRYPDWVSESGDNVKTQYTASSGALSSLVPVHSFGVPSTQGKAYALGLGNGAKVWAKEKKDDGSTSESKNAAFGCQETSFNPSISGNYSQNKDFTEKEWIDMNGDGLQDMAFNDGTVLFNTGYGFTNEYTFGHSAINENTSNTFGGGGGVSIPITGFVKISGGISFSSNTTENDFRITDINGDGLPDLIKEGEVAYNTGLGFSSFVSWKDGFMTKSKSTSMCTNGDLAYPIAIPLPFKIILTITPSVIGSQTKGVSRTLQQIMDVNGDGFPDLVESDENSKLTVRLNKMGHTNLLKTVHRPYGATMTVDYKDVGNTYDLPQNKTVMASVEVKTNMPENGATRMLTLFDYEDGYYDRYERDFFGFGQVKTTQIDTENEDKPYRTVIQSYDNRSFTTKNNLKSEVLEDADAFALKSTVNNYTLVTQPHDAQSIFPALTQTVVETREPGSSEVMRTSESYEYDAYGNITQYTSSVGGEDIVSEIAYHTITDKRILNIPQSIRVTTAEGEVRKRETDVDAMGNITQIRQFNTGYVANYDLTYDAYGNLTRLTRPENYKGERMYYAYTYDEVLHTLVTSVTDAFGYASSTRYDYKWAVPLETIDLNGHPMRYTYDNQGRMTSVTAPYELDTNAPYTIAFEYVTDAAVPYARTSHYDAQTGGSIDTYNFVDALMRPVQVKKTSVVYDGSADQTVMTVSGRVQYDAFGRAVKAYLPTQEPLSNATQYSTTTDDVAPTQTDYDVQDRAIKVTLPDGATTTTAFEMLPHDGQTMLATTLTDALGRSSTTYTDGRERTRTTLQRLKDEEVVVSYRYNPIGELLEVTHPNMHKTTYTYDKLGRKLSVNQPDAGLTTFTYDQANNLRTKQTPNLRKNIQEGGYITYEYSFERLQEILYPKNIYNRVSYTYGEPGADYNRAGRLTLVEDGSGGEAYYYGKMGEVTKTVKTIMLSLTDIRTYVWAAEYDSWNRVKSMTYPDNEVVTYQYNAAGTLQSISAEKEGESYPIITHQGYDKFGQMVYRKAGNGTETTYIYDPIRQRLQNMTLTAQGAEIMNNTYRYDAVDNILGITNTAAPQGEIGGTYAHTYGYDDLNRLITATGNSKEADYTLAMQYDKMGNPLEKNQTVNGSTVASSHTYHYLYNGTKPNAASMIGDNKYSYDENGNPTLREDTVSNSYRQMLWDEENRLTMLSDDGYTSRYTYNHSGERVIKSHGGSTGVFINANPQGILYHDADNYTLYVSPYMVVSKDRFTKHYYSGTQRVGSKIGVGDFNNLYITGSTNVTAGQKDYAERMTLIESARNDYYSGLGIPPGPPTAKGVWGEPEATGQALTSTTLGNYDIPDNWPQPPVKNQPGDVPGPPVQYGPAVNPEAVAPGYGFNQSLPQREDDIYFYHSDHLGSTSYVTDADANPTQFVCYMPFGEAFVDEHTTRPSMPYKFNGKEQDQETGLYYYGARYYDAKECRFYGVDPLAEQHPNYNPVAYCYNNPVNFIDPLGLDTLSHGATGVKAGDVYNNGDGTYTPAQSTQLNEVTVNPQVQNNQNPRDDKSLIREQENFVVPMDNTRISPDYLARGGNPVGYDQNGGLIIFGNSNWQPKERARHVDGQPIDMSYSAPIQYKMIGWFIGFMQPYSNPQEWNDGDTIILNWNYRVVPALTIMKINNTDTTFTPIRDGVTPPYGYKPPTSYDYYKRIK